MHFSGKHCHCKIKELHFWCYHLDLENRNSVATLISLIAKEEGINRRGCKSWSKRGGGNKREQKVKGVKSVTQSTRKGKFCKRLLNEEEAICSRREKNMKKQ